MASSAVPERVSFWRHPHAFFLNEDYRIKRHYPVSVFVAYRDFDQVPSVHFYIRTAEKLITVPKGGTTVKLWHEQLCYSLPGCSYLYLIDEGFGGHAPTDLLRQEYLGAQNHWKFSHPRAREDGIIAYTQIRVGHTDYEQLSKNAYQLPGRIPLPRHTTMVHIDKTFALSMGTELPIHQL